MVFATDGVITRTKEVGNGDKLIHMLTPERGRIGVMVKGAKSSASKLGAISQLFSYGNFEIYEKNKMYWLRGGEVQNSFYGLSSDIGRLALATYLCDLAEELTDEDEECGELMRLLLNSFHLLCMGKKDPRLIKAVFEFRAATMSGYLPELSGCVYCDTPYSEMTYLDVMGGRLICSDCLSKRSNKAPKQVDFDDLNEVSVLCTVPPAVLAALRYIAFSPANKMFSFEIKDDSELNDLSRAAEAYILNHLGRSFDSLDFYKAVK